MSENATGAVQEFKYRAQMQQLLHLIVHSLYTHKEIFLRELISNSSDALNKVRFLALSNPVLAEADQKISITLDAEASTLSIEDTGIGMNRADLIERIGTIASSGTLAFLREQQESDKPLDASLIGQFGVGFYASFMVADRIMVETRHASMEEPGYRWVSEGGDRYTIEEIDREQHGTTVTLHLKEDEKGFSEEHRVRQTIRKYSNFVEFPIFLEDTQVNTVEALWKKRKDEITEDERTEFYKFVTTDSQPPLGHLHLHIEGLVNVDAMLFIPSKAPPGLFREDYDHFVHLYASGVLIQSDARYLLPDYLLFVRGVVDTDDLPLNVSRETTQDSPVTAKIRDILAGKLLGLLKEWAEDEDQSRYTTFFSEFGKAFKTGLVTEYKRRNDLIELLRYPSTKTEAGSMTSLKAYVERMDENQEAIYYLLAEDIEVAQHSPHLEYFKAKDLEVLLFHEAIDVFTTPSLQTYNDKPLKSVESADLPLDDADETEEDASLPGDDQDKLLTLFRLKLGDKVEDVVASKRLVHSAAALTGGMDRQMGKMLRMMSQGASEAPKKTLELNLGHPLLRNLLALQEESTYEDLIDKTVHQVYEGALLVDGELTEATSFVQRMNDLLVEATKLQEQ